MQSHLPARALILIGVTVLAVSLAGCGRKGNLDLPPSAAVPAAADEAKSEKNFSPIAKPEKPKPRIVPQQNLPIDILLD